MNFWFQNGQLLCRKFKKLAHELLKQKMAQNVMAELSLKALLTVVNCNRNDGNGKNTSKEVLQQWIPWNK